MSDSSTVKLHRIHRMLWLSALEMLAWEIEKINQSKEDRLKIYNQVLELTADDLETVH